MDSSKQLSLKNSGLDERTRISQIIEDHLGLGKACARLHLLGEARYHFSTANFIAEYIYKEDSYGLSKIRFAYARFLCKNGCFQTAWEIAYRILGNHKSKDKEFYRAFEEGANIASDDFLEHRQFFES